MAIFIIAVGAILRFATSFTVDGIDVDTVGLILMIAGGVGLIVTLAYELLWIRSRQAPATAERQDPYREHRDRPPQR